MGDSAKPLSALISQVRTLRSTGLAAAEPHAATLTLGVYIASAIQAHGGELLRQLERYGWVQRDQAFAKDVDLVGLYHEVQKFKYQRLAEIGSGAYGVVHKAQNRDTHEIVAIKKLRYSLDGGGFPDSTIREICSLKQLRHPNIVELKDAIATVNSPNVYLILECMDCDLGRYLDTCAGASDVHQVKSIMFQIIRGIHHAHSHLVMHRDMKPQNVLVDTKTGIVKLTDFGLARQYLPPFKAYTEKVVTLYYRCPELLLGAPGYSTAVDMWSIGCIFAELANFAPLFKADSEIGMLHTIFKTLGTPGPDTWLDIVNTQHYRADFPQWHARDLSEICPTLAKFPEALDLLSRLLAYDPRKRISAYQAMSHPWFHDMGGSC